MSDRSSSSTIFCDASARPAAGGVAVGPRAGLVAEVRDIDAVALAALDDGLVGPADHGPAVELELDRHRRQLLRARAFHHETSCGKYFITLSAGFGAACPRPQIEASIIACESSASNGWVHFLSSIRASEI